MKVVFEEPKTGEKTLEYNHIYKVSHNSETKEEALLFFTQANMAVILWIKNNQLGLWTKKEVLLGFTLLEDVTDRVTISVGAKE